MADMQTVFIAGATGYIGRRLCAELVRRGLFERIPSTAQIARRLGMVTITQMVNALVYAVEQPVPGSRVFDVSRIRAPD